MCVFILSMFLLLHHFTVAWQQRKRSTTPHGNTYTGQHKSRIILATKTVSFCFWQHDFWAIHTIHSYFMLANLTSFSPHA